MLLNFQVLSFMLVTNNLGIAEGGISALLLI